MKNKGSVEKIETVLAQKRTWFTKEEMRKQTGLSDKTITDGLTELEKAGRIEVTFDRGKKMVRLKTKKKYCPVMSFQGVDEDRYQECIEEECRWWNEELQKCGPTIVNYPK